MRVSCVFHDHAAAQKCSMQHVPLVRHIQGILHSYLVFLFHDSLVSLSIAKQSGGNGMLIEKAKKILK